MQGRPQSPCRSPRKAGQQPKSRRGQTPRHYRIYKIRKKRDKTEYPFFASQDPIAIDSVCLDFLRGEQAAAEARGNKKWDQVIPADGTAENYLIEAALADNPPSGTVYQDGYGNPVGSLGVHERWNNASDKQYSRNLGKDEGIELISVGGR